MAEIAPSGKDPKDTLLDEIEKIKDKPSERKL